LFVQPDTVVRWHKKAFKLYWQRKSERGKRGRPTLDPEILDIVLKMADANPLWGTPKIHGELLKLGIELSGRTVSMSLAGRMEILTLWPLSASELAGSSTSFIDSVFSKSKLSSL